MIEYKLEANIQNVENMKKTVNRTNQLVHNTVLYMSYEEEKSYYILSKLQCLLMHNIPNTKAYLAAIFKLKHFLKNSFDGQNRVFYVVFTLFLKNIFCI